MKTIYLLLAVLGTAIPLTQFVPWVGIHGLNLPLFLSEIFSTRIGAFFGLDVLVSAVVVIAFAVHENRNGRLAHPWAPIAATCLVGVSCGLPLCLYLREARAARTAGLV